MTPDRFVLEYFAGPGGFSQGARMLGLDAVGVEYDRAACQTARANGHKRWLADVTSPEVRGYAWPPIWLFHASPSCQSFSMSGKGEGRKHLAAMAVALRKVAEGAMPEDALAAVADDALDERTELSLEPMVVIRRHRPANITFEQVPPVLPLWEAYAEILREWGYSVWTGLLSAEQFGVPQTRKRAILLASLEREVAPPAPTHSKYYPRSPEKLDNGVLPWVSMANALGTGATMRSNYGTGGDPRARGERPAPAPAPAVTSKIGRNKWTFAGAGAAAEHTITGAQSAAWVPATPNGGDASWVDDRPSPTIVGSFRPDVVAAPGWRKPGDGPRQNQPGSVSVSVSVSVSEAAVLQSFPADYVWHGNKGKQYEQIGNAVPPLLARAMVAAVLGLDPQSPRAE